ncbi:MAG: GNAT family N-acetyltransferase [Pyrinomonadaceae bacterium]
MSGIHISTLTANDWEFVNSIYLEGIGTAQATFETRAPTWAEWNSNHLTAPRLVATSEEQIVGWAALTPVSSRAVYAGVAEVSVYVANDRRGKGVGRALLETLVVESEKNAFWTLQASIFPENVASLALHKSCGFREVGRRERIGKMNGVWRDTILMERRSKLIG